MKRLLGAALLAVFLLATTQGTARATGDGSVGFGIGIGLNMNFKAGPTCNKNTCDSGGGSNCGCLPPPCWSGCYPTPMAYGGYNAMYNNPYAFAGQGYGGYGGYNPSYAYAGMNSYAPPPVAQTPPPPTAKKTVPTSTPAPVTTEN